VVVLPLAGKRVVTSRGDIRLPAAQQQALHQIIGIRLVAAHDRRLDAATDQRVVFGAAPALV